MTGLLAAAICLVAVSCSSGGSAADGGRDPQTTAISASTTDASTSQASQQVCDVLEVELPSSVVPADRADGPTSRHAGAVLIWMLETLDRKQVPVTIYLDPSVDDDGLKGVAEQVKSQPGVASIETVDREQTYDDFQSLFADNQKMVDSVDPTELPLSIRAEVQRDDVEALTVWAKGLDETYEVRSPTAAGTTQLPSAEVVRPDQGQWEQLADSLDHIEDAPAWAATSADLVRTMLDQGWAGASKLTDDLPAAHRDLVGAMESCTPS